MFPFLASLDCRIKVKGQLSVVGPNDITIFLHVLRLHFTMDREGALLFSVGVTTLAFDPCIAVNGCFRLDSLSRSKRHKNFS